MEGQRLKHINMYAHINVMNKMQFKVQSLESITPFPRKEIY